MTFDPARLGNSGRAYAAACAENRAALVGYLPVGFPDVATSVEAIVALTQGTDGVGCDVIEIGMPYSDPVMDGVAIQRAGTAALELSLTGKTKALATMCIGVGQGIAIALERA